MGRRGGKNCVWVCWNRQDCTELTSSATLIESLFLIIYIHTDNLFTVLAKCKALFFWFGVGELVLRL